MRDGSGNRMAKDISFTSKLANGYKVFGGYNRVNMSDNNYARTHKCKWQIKPQFCSRDNTTQQTIFFTLKFICGSF